MSSAAATGSARQPDEAALAASERGTPEPAVVTAYPARPEAVRARARENRLFLRWQRFGDERARRELVDRFLPLARDLARRFRRRRDGVDDLMQVASIGLLKAIDRFDPARGYAFSTFAVPTISGELKRHFRDHTWMVRPPRDIQELALRVDAQLTQCWQQLDRSPTTSELAAAIGVSDEHILEALQAYDGRSGLSLQAPVGEQADAAPLQDAIAIEDPDLSQAEMRADLNRLLKTVTPRAREMLRLRFEEDMTQAEIGALFGVSQMQVSRVLREAIARLRYVAEHRQLGGG